MLEKEIAFYNKHKKELLDNHKGKFVLIKGEKIIGIYNTHTEALSVGAREFGLDNFLIQEINQDIEAIDVPALTLGILNADIPFSDPA